MCFLERYDDAIGVTAATTFYRYCWDQGGDNWCIPWLSQWQV